MPSRLRCQQTAALLLGVLALAAALPATEPSPRVAAPEITNPAIRSILDSRNARFPEILEYLARGSLGDTSKALVEVRDLSALPLQERAPVKKLVRDENADRERMFREIAAATGTDLSQLPHIRETYATTLRQKARRGDWIQMPDGVWRQK